MNTNEIVLFYKMENVISKHTIWLEVFKMKASLYFYTKYCENKDDRSV